MEKFIGDYVGQNICGHRPVSNNNFKSILTLIRVGFLRVRFAVEGFKLPPPPPA